MKITSKEFGKTKNKEKVQEYTMTNDQGSSVSLLTLGGIISEICVPDSEGTIKNVVASFDTVEGYESCPAFIGAAIGRTGGRISNALLSIDHIDYPLAKNDGENNLHGGPNGLDKAIWSVSQYQDKDKMSLSLHYLSPDMESGFPGELDCNISYTFTNENTLTLKYTCTTDKKTYVNMTNHSYFNLSGDFTSKITDHILQIHSDNLVAVKEDTIPKALLPVSMTPFDFRFPKAIGKDIKSHHEQIIFGSGYDHAFELRHPLKGPNIIAEDPKTKRTLEVTTDAACVVFYTGNFLTEDYISRAGIPLHKRAAFCLETQDYPDAIHAPFVQAKFLEPGQVYRSQTSFKFT